MKAYKFLFFIVPAMSLFSTEGPGDVNDQVDYNVLRDYIDTQRKVTIKELGGRLSIAGEVRTEMQATGETKDGVRQRGTGGATDKPFLAWDVEVNLMIDYRAERTWATIKLEFDNNAGTTKFGGGSGTFDKLTVERAFIGARIFDEDTYTTDLMFGRRRLSYTFDSRLEFGSFMDGIVLNYSRAFDQYGNFYVTGGPFVVNENHSQYAWVFELGLLGAWNTGLYMKYSLIDWDTKTFERNDFNGTEEQKDNQVKVFSNRFNYFVSQATLGYKLRNRWDKSMTFYGAFLVNHAADPIKELTGHSKKNNAWYAGFSIGEARKKGDWSFDTNYQWVQTLAYPSFDSSGITVGNAAGIDLFGIGDGINQRPRDNFDNAVGNTNYRGFTMQLLYLWTNNLTMFQSWSQSQTLDKGKGPFMRYKQYEIELIYAF